MEHIFARKPLLPPNGVPGSGAAPSSRSLDRLVAHALSAFPRKVDKAWVIDLTVNGDSAAVQTPRPQVTAAAADAADWSPRRCGLCDYVRVYRTAASLNKHRAKYHGAAAAAVRLDDAASSDDDGADAVALSDMEANPLVRRVQPARLAKPPSSSAAFPAAAAAAAAWRPMAASPCTDSLAHLGLPPPLIRRSPGGGGATSNKDRPQPPVTSGGSGGGKGKAKGKAKTKTGARDAAYWLACAWWRRPPARKLLQAHGLGRLDAAGWVARLQGARFEFHNVRTGAHTADAAAWAALCGGPASAAARSLRALQWWREPKAAAEMGAVGHAAAARDGWRCLRGPGGRCTVLRPETNEQFASVAQFERYLDWASKPLDAAADVRAWNHVDDGGASPEPAQVAKRRGRTPDEPAEGEAAAPEPVPKRRRRTAAAEDAAAPVPPRRGAHAVGDRVEVAFNDEWAAATVDAAADGPGGHLYDVTYEALNRRKQRTTEQAVQGDRLRAVGGGEADSFLTALAAAPVPAPAKHQAPAACRGSPPAGEWYGALVYTDGATFHGKFDGPEPRLGERRADGAGASRLEWNQQRAMFEAILPRHRTAWKRAEAAVRRSGSAEGLCFLAD